MGLTNRLVTTALLVLIALGGAGLAAGADRQQVPDQRPEVTWAADQQAAPYVARLTADLNALQPAVTDLSQAARSALEAIQAPANGRSGAALASGDAATAELADFAATLNSDQTAASANVERWRLGPENSAQLDAVDAAVDAVADLGVQWSRVKSAQSASQISDALTAIEHDRGKVNDALIPAGFGVGQ